MMKPVAILAGLLAITAAAWWFLRNIPSDEPPIVEPGTPLAFDEPVDMRWVDDETGEDELWKVTKRDTEPAEREPAPLPEPDPNAGDHRPDESARTLHAMGLESWKRGEIVEAMEQLAQAIEVDPDDPLPRTQYGRLLVLGMSFGDALPHLERAAELSPDDPQVWLDLASIHERTRNLNASWEARRKAEELAGDLPILQDPVSGFWIVEGTSIYP
jgi:tetratricopeptide (TPR) repeat protein